MLQAERAVGPVLGLVRTSHRARLGDVADHDDREGVGVLVLVARVRGLHQVVGGVVDLGLLAGGALDARAREDRERVDEQDVDLGLLGGGDDRVGVVAVREENSLRALGEALVELEALELFVGDVAGLFGGGDHYFETALRHPRGELPTERALSATGARGEHEGVVAGDAAREHVVDARIARREAHDAPALERRHTRDVGGLDGLEIVFVFLALALFALLALALFALLSPALPTRVLAVEAGAPIGAHSAFLAAHGLAFVLLAIESTARGSAHALGGQRGLLADGPKVVAAHLRRRRRHGVHRQAGGAAREPLGAEKPALVTHLHDEPRSCGLWAGGGRRRAHGGHDHFDGLDTAGRTRRRGEVHTRTITRPSSRSTGNGPSESR